ncbi:uncharacterized protein LOC128157819 [Crassostrea angulata]|uniref:uncharacterized protein LOC128157819 n=1 Tax=Magallana angulata TaxID=2784310 RepID=UPI0022B1651E|nr:uncharacterized protein LOC128157819 [Crassostrea angulata]
MASEEENQGQHIVDCDLCETPVSFYCRRCGVNLCDSCLPIHMRVKSKNGHDVVDYVSKDDDDTCFCESHPKNECCAYCKTCNVPICMLCVSIKHKSHEMSELSDKIEELLNVIAKENERLQSFKHALETILDHTKKKLSSISSIYNQKKDEVTTRGEEWHKEIEKTVKKLHQELDDMQKEHEVLLKKQEAEYEEILKNLDQLNRKATSLQKSHDVKEMLTFIQMIEKQQVLTDLTQVSFPKFCVCKSEENILQTCFGYVEKLSEIKINFLEKKFRKNQLLQKRLLDVPLLTGIIDTGFPAHEKYSSRMYDMAITDDNKVWAGGNGELKLFDFQGNLHQTVNISWNGYHLCMYNNKVVYAGYRAVDMISNNKTVMKMFTTKDWTPHGVTSTASGDLLVCLSKDDDQSKVVRYSSTYKVLQEIQYDSHCQPLYRDADYITENVNRDIIVSDMKKSAVIAVNKLGIFRYSYSGNNQRLRPNSVASDNFGHVIISDFMETKIHMLDKDGKFMRYIIPEGGIKYPGGVFIIGHGEMIIGECKTGLAKIIKYLEE